MPDEEEYEGYLQIENGVGMTRLFIEEFKEELYSNSNSSNKKSLEINNLKKSLSLVTGQLATPIIKELIKQINKIYPNIHVSVYTL